MRYWLFENKEIVGPYAPDELSRLPGYSAKSLVCPEDRRGQDTRDWNWAEKFPELTDSLVQAHPARPGVNRFGQASAEPTLKDLKALGALQDKVDILERAVAKLQESLRAKEADLSDVHGTLVEKERTEAALRERCAELERRFMEVSGLRPALDEAVAAERSMETAVEAQRQELAALSAELSQLKEDLRVRAQPAAPPPHPPPPPPPPPAYAPAVVEPAFGEPQPPPLPAAEPEPYRPSPPPMPLASEPSAPPPRPNAAKLKAAAIGGAIGVAALIGWLLLRPAHKTKAPEPVEPIPAPVKTEAKIEEAAPPPPPQSPAPIMTAKDEKRVPKWMRKNPALPEKKAAAKPARRKKDLSGLPPPSLNSQPDAESPASKSDKWPEWDASGASETKPATQPKPEAKPEKLLLPGMEIRKPAPKAAPSLPPEPEAKPAAALPPAPKKLSEEELLQQLLKTDADNKQ